MGCTSGPGCLSEPAGGCFQPKQLLRGINLSPPFAAKLIRPRCGLVSGQAGRVSRQEALIAQQDLGMDRQTLVDWAGSLPAP